MSSSDSSATEREVLLGRLLDEYLSSLEAGSPLDLGELTSRHPSLADEIRSFAESLDMLHRATRPLQSEAPVEPPHGPTGLKRLGDFLIGPEIGRGGMGVVYEAVQLHLDRRVALKVLPFAAAWDQKQIARFRNEAQAAAQLHHPNIVPVFAVGEDRGVHYYAMQYVAGRSLDAVIEDLQAAAANRPSPGSTVATGGDTTGSLALSRSTSPDRPRRATLAQCRTAAELGVQAALAIHHAHEYGIVHRDIKPSNLILDHTAKVWVADFGLARVQNGPGVTMTGDVVGTLRYMSPEQAAGRHAEVDGRTDVYGLGATLYELLTLQPLYPGDDREAIRLAIASADPVTPRSLNPDIPADLETIVLHAVAKNREDRYPTAEAFADDLERFLAGKPTLARRPSLVDRGAKWLWRHRPLAAASVAVMAVLTTLSTVGVALLAQAINAKQEALEREQVSLQQARDVVDRFGIKLADELQNYPGTEPLQHVLREETLAYYLEFIQQAGDDSSHSDQLAGAHLRVATVSAKLGENARAAAGYRAALDILDRLASAGSGDPAHATQRATARNNLALVHAAAGDPENGVLECERAIEELGALPAAMRGLPRYQSALAEATINRGTLLTQLGRHDEATSSLQHAIGSLEALTLAAGGEGEVAHDLALAYNSLSVANRSAGRNAAALQAAERAVEILVMICGNEQVTDDWHADLALARSNLATLQGERGETAAAIESLNHAIKLRHSLFRRAPGVVRHRIELGISLNNVALLHLRHPDLDAAKAAFESADGVFASIVTDYPEQASYRSGWAALLNNQGLALAQAGRLEDATLAYEQSIVHQRRAMALVPASAQLQARRTLNTIYVNHGRALRGQARWQEAVASAIARRELCGGDHRGLTGVAAELVAAYDYGDASDQERVRWLVITTLVDALAADNGPKGAILADARLAPVAGWPESLLLGRQASLPSSPYHIGLPLPPTGSWTGMARR